MEAFVPPSTSASQYSKEAIGFLISAGVLAVVICIAWAYIHHKGGPRQMLRVYREQRKAKSEACDIELAQAENYARLVAIHEYQQRRAQTKARQEAQEIVTAVTTANGLVGSVVTPPQRVKFEEERNKEFDETIHVPRKKQMHVQKGKVVRKDSIDVSLEPAFDPMSFTMGRGKDMTALYS